MRANNSEMKSTLSILFLFCALSPTFGAKILTVSYYQTDGKNFDKKLIYDLQIFLIGYTGTRQVPLRNWKRDREIFVGSWT